jgi:hypothetical protein
MKYHFKSTTGEVIQSNNFSELQKLARLEPTNYVLIHRADGHKTQVTGAKRYNKWLHKKMIKEEMMNNSKAESLNIDQEQ